MLIRKFENLDPISKHNNHENIESFETSFNNTN